MFALTSLLHFSFQSCWLFLVTHHSWNLPPPDPTFKEGKCLTHSLYYEFSWKSSVWLRSGQVLPQKTFSHFFFIYMNTPLCAEVWLGTAAQSWEAILQRSLLCFWIILKGHMWFDDLYRLSAESWQPLSTLPLSLFWLHSDSLGGLPLHGWVAAFPQSLLLCCNTSHC